jgi:hypothetical protein
MNSTTPDDGPDPTRPPEHPVQPPPTAEPVSLDKSAGADPPLDFDPYRFGAPEHPVPPEYAPPGYRPPPAVPAPPPPPPAPYGSVPPPPYGTAPFGTAQHGTPPAGPYGMPPPPPLAHYGPPRGGHGKAIAALVLGIGSIVFCWLSILDGILVILALVFGLIALSEARREPHRGGRGLAIAGIACAVAGAILATVLTVYLNNRFKDCLDYPAGSQEYKPCITDRL